MQCVRCDDGGGREKKEREVKESNARRRVTYLGKLRTDSKLAQVESRFRHLLRVPLLAPSPALKTILNALLNRLRERRQIVRFDRRCNR